MPWNNYHLIKFCLLIGILAILPKSSAQGIKATKNFGIEDSLLIDQMITEATDSNSLNYQQRKLTEAYIISKNVGYQNGIISSLRKQIDLQQKFHNPIETLAACFSLLPVLEKIKHPLLPNYQDITAEIYMQQKIFNKAIEYYENELELQKSKEEKLRILHQIAQAAIYQYDYAKAKNTYYKILELHKPASSTDLTALAYCLHKSGQFDEALFNYKAALTQPNANIALIQNNMGNLYFSKNEYAKAAEYFSQAKQNALNTTEKIEAAQNLAACKKQMGQINMAIQILQNAIKQCNSPKLLAALKLQLSELYYFNGDINTARSYATEATLAAHSVCDYKSIAQGYFIEAICDQKIYDFENALLSYKKYLIYNDSFLTQELSIKQNIILNAQYLQKTEKENREIALNNQIRILSETQRQLETDKLKLQAEKLLLEAGKRDAEIITLKKEQDIKAAQLLNIELENDRNRQKLALAAQELLNANIQNKLVVLKEQEEKQRLLLKNKEAEEKQRLQRINLLEKEGKISKLQSEKQTAFRRTAYLVAALGGLLLLGALFGFFYARNKNKILAKKEY